MTRKRITLNKENTTRISRISLEGSRHQPKDGTWPLSANWDVNGHFQGYVRWACDNQMYLSFNLLSILFSVHSCLPKCRPYTSKFFSLSYYNSNTGLVGAGKDDIFIIAFCLILFTGLRACCMEYLLEPLAGSWGVCNSKSVTRFAEQAWLVCYYSSFWTLGLYIYCTSDYFLAPENLFTEWPTREIPKLTKAYILAQWAFWLQQLIVIHIEERRKDHWQMLVHHIITIALICTSYTLHLTRVANLILVLMDVVDIFFPFAKCLKYLGFTSLRDAMFGLFMVSWLLARHVLYILTMYHIWEYMPKAIAPGCYYRSWDGLIVGPPPLPKKGWSHMLEPFFNQSGFICYSDNIRWGFLIALAFLQGLMMVWFVSILQVAARVVKGIGADDIRSEDESEELEGIEGKVQVPLTDGWRDVNIHQWKT